MVLYHETRKAEWSILETKAHINPDNNFIFLSISSTDLNDEKSDTFKTLRIIPPLYYAL